MIEYKDRRYSLSENLPAPFGGRTTEEFFELRINDLRTYRTAYCIQMGVRANSGIGYEASDDYASFTEEQKALINTTLTLGYNMETGTKYGGSAIDEYIATQIPSSGSLPTTSLAQGMSQIVDEITANSPAAKPIFYTLRGKRDELPHGPVLYHRRPQCGWGLYPCPAVQREHREK